MEDSIIYNVLWIDDDETIVEGMLQMADCYGIRLLHFTNWQDGFGYLSREFDSVSAIILDANCKPAAESIEEPTFIYQVFAPLFQLFGERQRTIPWYILSAGTMTDFGKVIEIAARNRSDNDDDWGSLLYLKDVPASAENSRSALFDNICRAVSSQVNNISLFRHKEVFAYIGNFRPIRKEAGKELLKMLAALYEPEKNTKYEYHGNSIRKVMEYLFRSANDYGLLPDEVFDNNGNIRITDARKFMSGKEITAYDATPQYTVRWDQKGKGNGSGGNAILTKEIQDYVELLLKYGNETSHTARDAKPVENKELFFSYVMMLCHVTKWLGQYIEKHPHKYENEQHFKKTYAPAQVRSSVKCKEDFLNKPFLFKSGTIDGQPCRLDESIAKRTGVYTIVSIKENDGEDKDKYMFVVTEVKEN